MAERRRPKSPEDEGQPDFEDDAREKGTIWPDEETPLPSDRPLAALDRVTVAEQREGESINTRVAREVPDDVATPLEARPGRLYEPTDDEGNDIIKELVADETDDDAALSPEEAALHIVSDDEEL